MLIRCLLVNLFRLIVILLSRISCLILYLFATFLSVVFTTLRCLNEMSCNGLVVYDFLSVVLSLLSSYITFFRYLSIINRIRSKFLEVLLSILIVVLTICFTISRGFTFFFLFESVLRVLIFIVLGWGLQPERLQACRYILIYTVFGSLFFLLGLSFAYSVNLRDNMCFMFNIINKQYYYFWWLFILGFLVKIPIYPFHLWLPKAHVEAPVAGSILLAGVILKLGSYGLIRFGCMFIYRSNLTILSLIINICALGGVYCSIICLRQVDLKCLVAYSSVVHMRLVVLGILRNRFVGWMGAVMIIVGHGLCSSGLFLCVTCIYFSRGSRSLMINKGFYILRPLLSVFLFILTSRNIAAPPRLNLVGEVIIYLSCYSLSWFMFIFLRVIRFVGGAYCLFLYIICCHGRSSHYIYSQFSIQYVRFISLLFHWIPLNTLVLFIL